MEQVPTPQALLPAAKSSNKTMITLAIIMFFVLLASIGITIYLTVTKQKQIDDLNRQISSLQNVNNSSDLSNSSNSSNNTAVSVTSSVISSSECQTIYSDNNNTKIKLTNVTLNQKIVSPFALTGRIVGSLCFEGSCAVEVFGSDDTSLCHGFISISGDWMTDNLVDFTATLVFSKGAFTNGYILISSSNSTGDATNCTQLKFPVTF